LPHTPQQQKKLEKLNHFFKKIFSGRFEGLEKQKSARHIPLWNATGAKKKAHRLLGGLLRSFRFTEGCGDLRRFA
jgi:hypothetical protein